MITPFNPIQNEGEGTVGGGGGGGGGGQKGPLTSFSSATSGNKGISLQNFLAFKFNSFAILV